MRCARRPHEVKQSILASGFPASRGTPDGCFIEFDAMLTGADVAQLTRYVLVATFLLAAAFGAIVQRTDFCTMGAVADIVTMGSWTRMRQWALAGAVAIFGFAALAAGGWIRPEDSLYGGPQWMWLSAIVGGLMFGFGMVLASGCLSKNLVRLGAGNLKSLVALLVAALFSYMTLRGITAVLRVATVDQAFIGFAGPATLAHVAQSAFRWAPALALWVPALFVGGVLALWALVGRGFVNGTNLLAGVGIGAVIVAMWWVSGHLGYVAESPDTLESVYLASRTGRMEALSFTAPLADSINWLMFYSDSSLHLGMAVVAVVGVIVGAFAHAAATHRFHWQSFRTTEDLVNHMAGGALMGMGGVTALGCTVGEGLSGVSNLSLTAFTATASIITGAVIALKYQEWRLLKTL